MPLPPPAPPTVAPELVAVLFQLQQVLLGVTGGAAPNPTPPPTSNPDPSNPTPTSPVGSATPFYFFPASCPHAFCLQLDWSVYLQPPLVAGNTAIYTINLNHPECPWKSLPLTKDISLRSLYIQSSDGVRAEIKPSGGLVISADGLTATLTLSPPPIGSAIALLHRQADAKHFVAGSVQRST